MTERCPVEWYTNIRDEDDGAAEHACFLPEGKHVWHWCADHLACGPVSGAPAWFSDGS